MMTVCSIGEGAGKQPIHARGDVEVHRKHPGRFALVKPVDPTDPGVAETIAGWAATPGTVGIRLLLNRGGATDAADPGLQRVLATAARHALPVNLMCTGRLEQAAQLAGRHPPSFPQPVVPRPSHWETPEPPGQAAAQPRSALLRAAAAGDRAGAEAAASAGREAQLLAAACGREAWRKGRLYFLIRREQGIHMLDAPVSGGAIGARTGRLAVMVGGDEAIYQQVKPVLAAIGDNVVYCGSIGAGSVCKLVHNCIAAIAAQAISECFTLGLKAGVDAKALWETTRRGAFGRGAGGIHALPEAWFQGDFEPDWEKGFFSTALMRKDVGLTTQLAREFNVPMALANLAEQELVQASNRGWGSTPTGKVRLLQEERADVQVRGNFPAGRTRLVIEE